MIDPGEAWSGFCVVGLGGHARSKLIPAARLNGQRIVAAASRQAPEPDLSEAWFTQVSEAIATTPADCAVIVATPPQLHFPQVLAALSAGRDVVVEKPAFATAAQAIAAVDAAQGHDAILVEAFMHRYTRLYAQFRDDWEAKRPDVAAIHIQFTVPALPAGTFRQDAAIANSVLYDIGCYGLSLLGDIGLNLERVALARLTGTDPEFELIELSAELGDTRVSIVAGVAAEYQNAVTVTYANGSDARYAPFFYGRPGARSIERRWARETACHSFDEGDAFAAMLGTPRRTWRASQAARSAAMIGVSHALERLGRDVLDKRAQNDAGRD